MRRRHAAGAALAVVLVFAGTACGDDGGGGSDGALRVGETDPGDLDTEVPEGWRAVPLTDLGFGLALPPGWEDVVLDGNGMDLLNQADPGAGEFPVAALQAAQAGAVFYAADTGDAADAGDAEDVDDGSASAAPDDGVTDLKVMAELNRDGDVEGVEGLEALSDDRVAAATAGVDDDAVERLVVEPVEGVSYPAVDIRFGVPFPGEEADIGVEVAERLALTSDGVVLSFIVTGEDTATVDALAEELFATLDLV